VEAVLFSPLGSGAALVPNGVAVPIEGSSGAALVPNGVAVPIEGASGVMVVLATEGQRELPP
jgi:hypothetical protein